MLFGLFVLFQPGAGALALIWVIGGYALFFGGLLIVLAFKLKGHGGRVAAQRPRGGLELVADGLSPFLRSAA